MNENESGYGGQARIGWLFNLPLLLITFLSVVIPVGGTLLTSFYCDVNPPMPL